MTTAISGTCVCPITPTCPLLGTVALGPQSVLGDRNACHCWSDPLSTTTTRYMIPAHICNKIMNKTLKTMNTRMHSSRMRTGRSLTVCRGVHACRRGGACFLGGCMLPGGCMLWGGCPGMHWGRPPPNVNRITDTSKNITLATTSLRPVKILKSGTF